MKRSYFILLILFFLNTVTAEEPVSQHDLMGGWKNISAEAQLFFYTRPVDGIWWFFNPAGNAFLSKGVSQVSFTGDFSPALSRSPYWQNATKKYKQSHLWTDAAVDRLKQWNFNTVGANSTPSLYKKEMPYTLMLDICFKTGGNRRSGFLPDVFDQDFKRKIMHTVRTKCANRENDIYLLGYFSDHELHWGEDEKSHTSLLINYLFLPMKTDGGKYAHQFLQKKYRDITSLNEAWGLHLGTFAEINTVKVFPVSEQRSLDEADFLTLVAEQYFRTCYESIKEVDPNHLYFGCQFRGQVPEPVLTAMKQYVDVVCYNNYDFEPPRDELLEIFEITKKPIMLTEFSFKANDAKLPNTIGAGKTLSTQSVRAKLFDLYISDIMELPFMVGYHWVQYADQPAEGTKYGENNNYGLVNIQDEPWEELTDVIANTNKKIDRIHAGLR